MKRNLAIISLLIILGGNNLIANELTVPEGSILSPMLRSTHFVSNIDESLKLYRDILGLQIRADLILEGDRSNKVLGTKNKKVRAVVLKSGDLFNGGVGLFQFLNSSQKNTKRTDSFAKPGDSALVFITSDIFGVYEKVKSNNYLIASSPMILFPKDNSIAQDYEMLFFDNDGIGINLIQRSLILD
jgi:hypothetical protein